MMMVLYLGPIRISGFGVMVKSPEEPFVWLVCCLNRWVAPRRFMQSQLSERHEKLKRLQARANRGLAPTFWMLKRAD